MISFMYVYFYKLINRRFQFIAIVLQNIISFETTSSCERCTPYRVLWILIIWTPTAASSRINSLLLKRPSWCYLLAIAGLATICWCWCWCLNFLFLPSLGPTHRPTYVLIIGWHRHLPPHNHVEKNRWKTECNAYSAEPAALSISSDYHNMNISLSLLQGVNVSIIW